MQRHERQNRAFAAELDSSTRDAVGISPPTASERSKAVNESVHAYDRSATDDAEWHETHDAPRRIKPAVLLCTLVIALFRQGEAILNGSVIRTDNHLAHAFPDGLTLVAQAKIDGGLAVWHRCPLEDV